MDSIIPWAKDEPVPKQSDLLLSEFWRIRKYNCTDNERKEGTQLAKSKINPKIKPVNQGIIL